MIELINITKKYGEKTVYDNFSETFEEKKITAILGESGSGKTTLLNIIAGLTDYDGEVKGVGKTSMVFQRDRLVKHLTAEENVLLVNPKADIKTLFSEVGLFGAEKLYPKELSAGMARRVAVVRAFAFDAPLLIMDEPFVNLDLSVKFSIMEDVKKMKEKYEKTVIFVTHDVKEAAILADRVMVIKNGVKIYDAEKGKGTEENALVKILLA